MFWCAAKLVSPKDFSEIEVLYILLLCYFVADDLCVTSSRLQCGWQETVLHCGGLLGLLKSAHCVVLSYSYVLPHSSDQGFSLPLVSSSPWPRFFLSCITYDMTHDMIYDMNHVNINGRMFHRSAINYKEVHRAKVKYHQNNKHLWLSNHASCV